MDEGDEKNILGEDLSEEDNSNSLLPTNEEYEYVDEEGNPINPEELDEEYEYVDEEGNPIESEEEPITPEPTQIIHPEEPKIHQEAEIFEPNQETLEELTPFENVYSSRIDSLEKSVPKHSQITPVGEKDLLELQRIAKTEQEKTTADEILRDIGEISGIPLNELRKKTQFPIQKTIAPKKEPIQEVVHEDHSDLLLSISNPRARINTDTDELIRKARESQREVEQIKQPITPEPTQITHPEEAKIYQPIQKTIEKPVQEQTEQEKNEELFKKLTMKNPTLKTPQSNSHEQKEEPYVYNEGHPHIGTTYSMDTISNLTKRLFNSDEAVKKLDKNKKR